MKILLAIDGSGHSEAAIGEISRRNFAPQTNVRIISVVEPYSPIMYGGGSVDPALYEKAEKFERERARRAVDNAELAIQAGEEHREYNVTTAVLSGSPKRVILDDAAAFGADLIVVGSHGHGGLGGFLLGSVAQAVALHANCSVEIVRAGNSHTTEKK